MVNIVRRNFYTLPCKARSNTLPHCHIATLQHIAMQGKRSLSINTMHVIHTIVCIIIDRNHVHIGIINSCSPFICKFFLAECNSAFKHRLMCIVAACMKICVHGANETRTYNIDQPSPHKHILWRLMEHMHNITHPNDARRAM